MLNDGHRGMLATVKRDGRPQLSNVVYVYTDGAIRISVTDDRAKTANLRRDPRASFHVSPDFWTYAVAEGTAELTPVAQSPDDATVDELVDIYRSVSGEHPDWTEFREAMVAQRRLVIRVRVDRLYGQA